MVWPKEEKKIDIASWVQCGYHTCNTRTRLNTMNSLLQKVCWCFVNTFWAKWGTKTSFFLSTLWKYYLNPLWIKRLMIRNVLVVLWGLHLTWWVYFPYLLFSEFPCWLWVLPFYICLGVDSWISYIWTLGFVNLHVHFFLQTWKVSGYESFK